MRIVFVGGGTAGSVSPLLAIFEVLQKQKRDKALDGVFIGGRMGPERRMAKAAGLHYEAISAGKFRRYFSWRTLFAPIEAAVGFLEAFLLLRRFRPNAVLSAGSYIAVPVVWAAALLGIPRLIHQQDILSGLANRMMVPVARAITVSFPESARDFPADKVTHTGNPVRQQILHGDKARAQNFFHLNKEKSTILVLGGGIGAQPINTLLGDAVYALTKHTQIIHLTGDGKQPIQSREHYHGYHFLDGEKMADAYAAADIVVCRAGISTLTELAALKKAAIVIPMPETHQEANARYFVDRHAAILMNQNTDAATFAQKIIELLQDKTELKRLAEAIGALHSADAAERVQNVLLHITSHDS